MAVVEDGAMVEVWILAVGQMVMAVAAAGIMEVKYLFENSQISYYIKWVNLTKIYI